MRQRSPALALTAAAAVLVPLAGCAAGSLPHSSAAPSAHDEAFENYLAYAGPPIDHFTWLGRFYSWQPLGKDRLVVFTTPGDAYLLKVWPPCDLRFVINAIGITRWTTRACRPTCGRTHSATRPHARARPNSRSSSRSSPGELRRGARRTGRSASAIARSLGSLRSARLTVARSLGSLRSARLVR
jgi:hypothetical protein